ncbi:MAG: 3-methyl-2-oxobutanoate hydroxymethyltransferase [Deltaproteobacteria bacterium]|jgi:3-methyl-2-oxobutanoate hydroxymethyltransferase|nr:3-methyl-2-oxobutanoate hydroxymethyltransferase [Deltaproteobacteria bacterium]
MARKSLLDLYKMKEKGEKIAWLTSYDYPTAQFGQAAGLDMILVGDSLGMCVYGYNGTVPVTMEQCLIHTEAVRRGAPDVYLVGDMPFLSYQTSDADAVLNAGLFLKRADVDAVKLEGGVRVAGRIKAISEAGIVVVGHIGLTPQSSGQLGGHRAQGRTAEAAKATLEDALAVEKAGARLLLVEAVPPEVTAIIHKALTIPVLSIGAGPDCDGQLLIVSDLIGQFQAFTPKFVKKYANVAEVVTKAIKSYVQEVKSGKFPGPEHSYDMLPGEEEKLRKLLGGPVKKAAKKAPK